MTRKYGLIFRNCRENCERSSTSCLSFSCSFSIINLPGLRVKATDFSQVGGTAPCVYDLYLVLLRFLFCNYYFSEPTPRPHNLIHIL